MLGQPEHTALARRALANLERQLARRRVPFTIGAFDGWGGLVYTWLYLARLWNDRTLVEKALAALPKIEQALEEDDYLDIVRGCAGGIRRCSPFTGKPATRNPSSWRNAWATAWWRRREPSAKRSGGRPNRFRSTP